MGGINCPPPPARLGEIPDELRNEYVVQLATYCKHLFSGVSSFFSAHALIEEAVIENSSLSLVAVELGSSANHLAEARKSLGTFQSLWMSVFVSDDTETPNFIKQHQAIDEASRLIDEASRLIDEIMQGEPIQEQLWNHSTLLQSFTESAVLISSAISWQTAFASQHTAVSV